MAQVNIVKLIDNPVALQFTGGVNAHGAYDAGHPYVTGDSVSYNGSSYVAIQSTTGNLPTDTSYWQVLAVKGDKGDTGDSGITVSDTAPVSPVLNQLWVDSSLF